MAVEHLRIFSFLLYTVQFQYTIPLKKCTRVLLNPLWYERYRMITSTNYFRTASNYQLPNNYSKSNS